MYISPYIAEALENPVAKIFATPEDVLNDLNLSKYEKQVLLSKLQSKNH